MRSLQYIGAGRLRWEERTAPVLGGAGEALVRPVAASICDIDRPLLEGRSPWTGPLAFGHEAVAVVLDAGDAVRTVRPGDLVAVTWHISCGTCEHCRRGLTAHCTSVPPQAMYGLPVGGDWGGLFDDVVRVPFADAMLTRVPDGVDPVAAVSAGDNLSLGQEIMARHLAAGRRRVLVLGAAAVGINQVAVGVALGAEVVYVDDDPGNRAVATGLGATALPGPPDRAMGRFDLAVDASFRPAWLRRALRMVVPEGVVECLGGYFEDVAVPTFAMYVEGVTLRLGRANTGPHVAPTLDLLRGGAVAPATWSQVVSWDDAPAALVEPTLKPVAVRDA